MSNSKETDLSTTKETEMAKPQKPVSVERADFIKNIAEVVNNSMLPAFIIESILKDVYYEIKSIAQKQYEMDLKEYESALSSYETSQK